ncbi:TPA: hypothetical protein N0F65_012040, partial [Lagenidium giganteum]
NGLDFRPISLLATDYKIFTRVLANRLRPLLPSIGHPGQAGFVPGQDIHAAIDAFQRHQETESANPDSEAVALLLDFAKDTLKRDHMLDALADAGLPWEFRLIVAAMHRNTQATFLVNGFQSAPLLVTRGIRQGCPLAPMLFILALNPLYTKQSQHPGIKGLRLPDAIEDDTVKGFADDTALYR